MVALLLQTKTVKRQACANNIDWPGNEGNVTVAIRFQNCAIAE
jgi:hypothetical protein